MATELYLVRHGEAVANVEPVIGGMRGDAGLTPRGRDQARLLQERLLDQRMHADRLVSSTLPRALQTAEYVARALRLPVLRDDGLHELRPGEADGLTVERTTMNLLRTSNQNGAPSVTASAVTSQPSSMRRPDPTHPAPSQVASCGAGQPIRKPA